MAKYEVYTETENLWGDVVTIYEHKETYFAFAEYVGDDGETHIRLFPDAETAYDWAFCKGFLE